MADCSRSVCCRAIVIQFVPEDSGFLGQVPYLVSLLFGAFMARLGYTCIRISTAKSHASIAAMFLFLPFTWVLTLLICNGKIQDVLYKHAGSVGFFGVTEKQLEKLTSPDSRSR